MMILSSQFTTVIQRLRIYEANRLPQWERMAKIRESIELVADEFERVVSPWFSDQNPERKVSIELVGQLVDATVNRFTSLVIESFEIAINDAIHGTNPASIALRQEVANQQPYTASIDFPLMVAHYLSGESETPAPCDDHQPVHLVATVLEKYLSIPQAARRSIKWKG